MIVTSDIELESLVIHKVGNKSKAEEVQLSQAPLTVETEIKDLLIHYFLSPFKSEEYFNLYHETDLNMNEVFSYATALFENPDSIYEQSVNLAKHLYEASTHPKVKAGEFYVVYFKNSIVDGETLDAIGIFKSESKETFLKVYPTENTFRVQQDSGVSINKLDKGCIIFNTEQENGYLLSIVDKTNAKNEARYWCEDFLNITQRKDNYYQTQQVMSLCKDFITEKLPEQFEVSRADQAELLNRSAAFMKEHDAFLMNEFENQVMQQPEIKESFEEYKAEFEENFDTEIAQSFGIAKPAVKKNQRFFKTILKLDKNFSIYIHGNRDRIERGKDEETGLSYYKFLFESEK